jgi:hypothetical protein
MCAIVIHDISEERIASIFRVQRIGELETMLAVTRDRSTQKSALTSPAAAVDPVGIVRLRTDSHGVCLFVCLVGFLTTEPSYAHQHLKTLAIVHTHI